MSNVQERAVQQQAPSPSGPVRASGGNGLSCGNSKVEFEGWQNAPPRQLGLRARQ